MPKEQAARGDRVSSREMISHPLVFSHKQVSFFEWHEPERASAYNVVGIIVCTTAQPEI